jgi:hypothetical protein
MAPANYETAPTKPTMTAMAVFFPIPATSKTKTGLLTFVISVCKVLEMKITFLR